MPRERQRAVRRAAVGSFADGAAIKVDARGGQLEFSRAESEKPTRAAAPA